MLNDVAILRDCIPGCDTLEAAEDGSLKATVTTRIGPVKARFAGAVTFADVLAPERCTIAGSGSGGIAGFAKGSATVVLAEDGTGTLLTYAAHAEVGGKLAQLGSRLIDSTARKLAGEFFSNFVAKAADDASTPLAESGGEQGAAPHEIAIPAI